eukprot:TRINITY_DN2845_c0_g1_i1.p1 TRINITY_DN2845_c0_g1~~TRINITY_DN2845_c0_g1_i1.p1  ORF type:complete len:199 (+),score=34.30 TRINITY_DN2845_c0_g1_i1:95-691(+)
MVEPAFVMHWSEDIPRVVTPDGLGSVTVWAGTILGASGLQPTPHSWAADPDNEVAVWHITLSPGGVLILPSARFGKVINRGLYFVEGSSLSVSERIYSTRKHLTLNAASTVQIGNPATNDEATEVLILQGRPINEPVAKRGPFVMNTQQEIQSTISEFRRTRFGGWTWPRDDMVFPLEKSKFALVDGVEYFPPTEVAQ